MAKFHEVILRMARSINVENILDSERTRLGTMMDIAASCDIDGLHDEIIGAFRWAYRGLMNMNPPEYLLKHIAAEKARCQNEAAELKKIRRGQINLDAYVDRRGNGYWEMGEEGGL